MSRCGLWQAVTTKEECIHILSPCGPRTILRGRKNLRQKSFDMAWHAHRGTNVREDGKQAVAGGGGFGEDALVAGLGVALVVFCHGLSWPRTSADER